MLLGRFRLAWSVSENQNSAEINESWRATLWLMGKDNSEYEKVQE